MVPPSDTPKPDMVTAYKTILRDIIDRRPSGTRQRLADALATNRSFITQITNPAYAIPVPAQHLAAIFRVCHFSPAERDQFLKAYRQAHPGRPVAVAEHAATRVLHVVLPDLGSEAKNRSLDRLLRTFAANISELLAEPDGPPAAQEQEPGPARRRTRS
jgi:hypothetical protein